MPYSTFIVRQVFKDPSKGRLVGPDGAFIEFQANRNNVAVVDFPNDDGVSQPITYFMNGVDLSNTSIAAQAFSVIATLNAQESGLASITVGRALPPTPPNPAIATLAAKQIAFASATRDAVVKARNDLTEVQALADLKAAETAAAATTSVTPTPVVAAAIAAPTTAAAASISKP